MAFIQTVPIAEARGSVREMYLRLQKPSGSVPNYARVFSHRPEVMQAWAELQRAIQRSVDPQTYQLVTLAASQALGSSYCSLAYGSKLCEGTYSNAQLADVVSNEDTIHLDDRQRAIMSLARKVATDSNLVGQDDIDELRERGMADDAIFDIVAIASARCFFATVVNALGAQPDAHYTNMEPGLRELLCVGRKINESQPERLE